MIEPNEEAAFFRIIEVVCAQNVSRPTMQRFVVSAAGLFMLLNPEMAPSVERLMTWKGWKEGESEPEYLKRVIAEEFVKIKERRIP